MLGGGSVTVIHSGVTEAPPSFCAVTRYFATGAPCDGVPASVPVVAENERPPGSTPPTSPLGVALTIENVTPSTPPTLATSLVAIGAP